ncbi:hypothetical protein COV87_01445 [Candidatus Roizmanbacteria bacterium CG11_big_fil_rev_8_21_14_0_20_37_16]|uniref:phosphoribosylglycinamide formyltransferase 1 n=1 Tax=Candidatus Roizmanbacteria bacterium CG11_big_fil_rev_8_21_14_0_20_37_16 TaxID=1974857 RepID=A0A2H0KKK7_9BACT|nr:MAG: hypothetical protein COV87_01445 [Candidatus Roizmanbacteria bacterium CG11_big_fil_rev_8_21_14_0_20_37_16]
MLALAILISNAGTGTNLQAIIDAIENKNLGAKIAIVMSSDENAYGIERAKRHNISYLVVNKNENVEDLLQAQYKVDLVVLAGWKRIIPPSTITSFKDRILNLHPGLIPDIMNGFVSNPDGTKGLWNRGMMTNKAIRNFLDKKATYAGSTVHFLSNEFDFGPILGRCFERINENDTVESLYSRLKQKENRMYVASLIQLSKQHS